jgi:hypothetical protein
MIRRASHTPSLFTADQPVNHPTALTEIPVRGMSGSWRRVWTQVASSVVANTLIPSPSDDVDLPLP